MRSCRLDIYEGVAAPYVSDPHVHEGPNDLLHGSFLFCNCDRRLSNLLLRGRNAYSQWVNEINGANLTGQLDGLGPSFLLSFSEERQQELIR